MIASTQSFGSLQYVCRSATFFTGPYFLKMSTISFDVHCSNLWIRNRIEWRALNEKNEWQKRNTHTWFYYVLCPNYNVFRRNRKMFRMPRRHFNVIPASKLDVFFWKTVHKNRCQPTHETHFLEESSFAFNPFSTGLLPQYRTLRFATVATCHKLDINTLTRSRLHNYYTFFCLQLQK